MKSFQTLLDIGDLSEEQLTEIFSLADYIVGGGALPDFRGMRAVFYSTEPTTRTRGSFERAFARLQAGMTFMYEGSSREKDEPLDQALQTLEDLGHGFLIVRTSDHHELVQAAAGLTWPTRLINAGTGNHAHPTQTLADLYIVRAHYGGLGGLRVALVGDVLHSRVATGLAAALHRAGAQVVYAGPAALLPPTGGPIPQAASLADALEGAQVVVALRCQLERWPDQRYFDGAASEWADAVARDYRLTAERLGRHCPEAIVLHPQPMMLDTEIARDVAYGPQSRIRQQVRAGVPVRTALLLGMLGITNER